MDTFLWVLQWVLAAMFLMAGMMKLMQPKETRPEHGVDQRLRVEHDQTHRYRRSSPQGLPFSSRWCSIVLVTWRYSPPLRSGWMVVRVAWG